MSTETELQPAVRPGTVRRDSKRKGRRQHESHYLITVDMAIWLSALSKSQEPQCKKGKKCANVPPEIGTVPLFGTVWSRLLSVPSDRDVFSVKMNVVM